MCEVSQPRDDIDAEGAQETVRLQELFVSEVRAHQGEAEDHGGTGEEFFNDALSAYIVN